MKKYPYILNRLIETNYNIVKFKNLPKEYQLALIWYMAIDNDEWSDESFRIPEVDFTEEPSAFKERLALTIPAFVDKYGEFDFGVSLINTERLKKVVLENESINDDYSNWDDYHDWYVAEEGFVLHSHKHRWPIILADDNEEVIKDGWHRFHNYVHNGDIDIPAVFLPNTEHVINKNKKDYELTKSYRRMYIRDFLQQLVERTGRTESELLLNGLSAFDFDKSVKVKLDDETEIKMRRSFYVQNEDETCLFTEHYGYFCFDNDSIIKIEQK